MTSIKKEDVKKNVAAAAQSIKEAAAAVAGDPRRAKLDEWRKSRGGSSVSAQSTNTTSPDNSSSSSAGSSSGTEAVMSSSPRSLGATHRRKGSSSKLDLHSPLDTKASLLRKSASSVSNASNSSSNITRTSSGPSINNMKKQNSKIPPPSSTRAKAAPQNVSAANRSLSSSNHKKHSPNNNDTWPKQSNPNSKPKPNKKTHKKQSLPTIHSTFKHHPHATSSKDDEQILFEIESQHSNDSDEKSSIYSSSQSSPNTEKHHSSFFSNLFSFHRKDHSKDEDDDDDEPIVLEATAVDDVNIVAADIPIASSPSNRNGHSHHDNNHNDQNGKHKLSSFLNRSKLHFPKQSSTTNQQNSNEQLTNLQSENDSLKTQLSQKQTELDSLLQRFSSIGLEKNQLQLDAALHHEELTNIQQMNETLESEIESLTKEKWEAAEQYRIMSEQLTEFGAVQGTMTALQKELEEKKRTWEEEKVEMKRECDTLVEKLKFDLRVLRIKNSTLGSSSSTNDDHDDNSNPEVEASPSVEGNYDENDAAVLHAKIEERDEKIMELESKLADGETLRRKMHNQIQELRGNVRVYCRTRPFLHHDNGNEEKEEEETSSPITIHPNGNSLTIINKEKEEQLFQLDKVFTPTVSQSAVFDEVSDFVQSAIDGYNVCLFSYGQTGSGKTHTMQGSGNGDLRGIIPRAVELILDKTQGKKGWTFDLKTSFLEIYNEDLKDLLVAVPGSPWENKSEENDEKKATNKNNTKLAIKKNADGRTYVKNLKQVTIDTSNTSSGMKTLEDVMTCAARSRSVAFTHMNATSSRSHSVFTLDICGTNTTNGLVVHGTLNLCDLAGSERLDRSNHDTTTPDGIARLKETQSINKSLSTLGDVFGALSNGASHVPYRNSKLTYLLQDCLGGDGKALMFVNLSPTVESSFESLCSLRFAQRVNQVELGRATRDVSQGSTTGASSMD